MNLDSLSNTCKAILHSYSTSTLNNYVGCLDKIREFISKSTDSYLIKLQQLQKSDVFKAFNKILHNPLETNIQLKLLRFCDFLYQTCSSTNEITLIFDEGITNSILTYPFDLSSIDVLQSYMTILKGLAIKLKIIPIMYIFSEAHQKCAIFDQAIAQISNQDSTTVAAARFIVLNLFTCKNDALIEIISSNATKNQFEHLIESLDSDGFAFIVDVLNVVSLELREFIIEKLRITLLKLNPNFIGRALSFLADSPARTMIMEILPSIITKLNIKQPSTLAILLFSLEKKLFLIDKASSLGLIQLGPMPSIKRFSMSLKKSTSKSRIFQKLTLIFQERESTLNMALVLRIFENICSEPPSIVKTIKKTLISDLKSESTIELCEILSGRIASRQRTDLDYVLNPKKEQNKGKLFTLVTQLAEIEASLARYNKKSFIWFNLASISSTYAQAFVLADETNLILTPNEIKLLDEARSLKLWDTYIEPLPSKSSKSVTLWSNNQQSKRKSLSLNERVKTVLQFPSASSAALFESEVQYRKIDLALATLDSLSSQI